MKKQSLLAMSLLTSIAVLSGCNQNDMEKQIQPEKKTEDGQVQQGQPSEAVQTDENGKVQKTAEQLIQEKFDEKDAEIEELTEEVQYYRTFVKDFTSTFSSEEMQEFVDKEWTYQLTINDINFPKNGVLELTTPTFDLVLTEEKVPYSVIPDDMSEEGKVVEELNKTVEFSGEVKPEVKEDAEGKLSSVTYSFKDVPSKTVIEMTITKKMQEELKLDSPNLEIHIK